MGHSESTDVVNNNFQVFTATLRRLVIAPISGKKEGVNRLYAKLTKNMLGLCVCYE